MRFLCNFFFIKFFFPFTCGLFIITHSRLHLYLGFAFGPYHTYMIQLLCGKAAFTPTANSGG